MDKNEITQLKPGRYIRNWPKYVIILRFKLPYEINL